MYIIVLLMTTIQFGSFIMKTSFIVKGSKVRSSILSVTDILAWGIGGSGFIVAKIFDEPKILIPWAIGSTLGVTLGMLATRKFDTKKTTVIVMSKKEKTNEISDKLIIENYGVTELEGDYKSKVLLIATTANKIKNLKKTVKNIDKLATIITNSKVSVHGGYLY